MFKSSGFLRYNPRMEGQKVFEPHWLILKCDDEITRYYRRLIFKGTYQKIADPGWGAHITVLRNETPKDVSLWGLCKGKNFEFEYEHIVRDNTKHFWLRAYCPALMDVREAYGLPRDPVIPFHLTVGNMS